MTTLTLKLTPELQLNLGLSPETWEQYEVLIAKRQSEKLTPEEQKTLIAISDRMEKANARRIEALSIPLIQALPVIILGLKVIRSRFFSIDLSPIFG